MDIQPTIDNQQMLPKGTVLHGTYRIERYLASGGFGNTYVAIHLKLKRKFAVKEFFLKNINERSDDSMTVTVSKSNTALYEQQRAKFEKEAQRIYDLSQDAANSHIVHVTDLFDENNTVYYVMDYIDGQSLSVRMKQQGRPFTEQEVVPFIEALADALQTVHALSLQHLDIKPGNIMQDRQGHIFLIDFGASKQIGGDGYNTTTTSMCYTKGYAPFEQVDQLIKSIGPWTDIYAVGATVYNLLTQQSPPLPTEINQEGDEAFAFPASVSQRMRRFILSCMQPKYKQRPQSVAEMLELLKKEPKAPEAPVAKVAIAEGEKSTHASRPILSETTQLEDTLRPKARNKMKIAGWIMLGMAMLIWVVFIVFMLLPKGNSTEENGNALVAQTDSADTTSSKEPKIVEPEVKTPKTRETFTVNGVSFDMIRVEGGTYYMGAQSSKSSAKNYDPAAWDEEGPVHEETVSTFYIGETEVTQELWNAVMGNLPSYLVSSHDLKGPKRPVCNVSWNDCQTFIKKLNSKTERKFRLPTEAEWEYAARGGNKSKGYNYSGGNDLEEVAWCSYNSYSDSHPVKQKAANELGLYDMIGNVEELTSSYWRENYNASEDRSRRVCRGGSWNCLEFDCRMSRRCFIPPVSIGQDLGLRLALDPR